MPAIIARNWINVRPGDRCFVLSSNLCDFFQIGDQSTTYLLHAEMVGPEREFLFNGRLFLPGNSQPGTVIDNFPKGPTPHGWIKRQRVDGNGYELVDRTNGIALFGFEEIEDICHVTTNVYDGAGNLIVETLPDNFLVHRGPAMVGKGGIYIS
jgi:hypothetical protein